MKHEKYQSALSLRKTESAIKIIKDNFEKSLASTLNLQRVSAPLFVSAEMGLNDNLNGIERPVGFDIKETNTNAEIVHSLAKWKRFVLKRYGFENDEGLYTDMDAIRRDEIADPLHSIYVDQWDWELVIDKSKRSFETLRRCSSAVYESLLKAREALQEEFPELLPLYDLPPELNYVTTQELEDLYPDLSPHDRETAYAREHHAYFLSQIGGELKSGKMHDGRAPDYDDWSMNGDIFVYHPELDCAFELSSMGVRVDEEALLKQLKIRGLESHMEFPFHKALLAGELPYTIGGGIGQSRVCMFLLKKIHIGEVQVSIWPESVQEACEEQGIELL